jgi:hypothetical protein
VAAPRGLFNSYLMKSQGFEVLFPAALVSARPTRLEARVAAQRVEGWFNFEGGQNTDVIGSVRKGVTSVQQQSTDGLTLIAS